MKSSRNRLANRPRVHGMSSSTGSGIGPAPRARTRDDLAGVEVRAGVGALEERPQHRYARGRDVFFEPLGMLGADSMVVGERRARIHEGLLDRALDHAVVVEAVVVARRIERE